MKLIDEIRNEQKQHDNDTQIVKNEILDKFKNYFESEIFKEFLKQKCKDAINDNEKEIGFKVEFWEYRTGCSPTNFSAAGYSWRLKPEKKDYKGITLRNIQNEVCEDIWNNLKSTVQELGFTIIRSNDYESRFGYFDKKMTITW